MRMSWRECSSTALDSIRRARQPNYAFLKFAKEAVCVFGRTNFILTDVMMCACVIAASSVHGATVRRVNHSHDDD